MRPCRYANQTRWLPTQSPFSQVHKLRTAKKSNGHKKVLRMNLSCLNILSAEQVSLFAGKSLRSSAGLLETNMIEACLSRG